MLRYAPIPKLNFPFFQYPESCMYDRQVIYPWVTSPVLPVSKFCLFILYCKETHYVFFLFFFFNLSLCLLITSWPQALWKPVPITGSFTYPCFCTCYFLVLLSPIETSFQSQIQMGILSCTCQEDILVPYVYASKDSCLPLLLLSKHCLGICLFIPLIWALPISLQWSG